MVAVAAAKQKEAEYWLLYLQQTQDDTITLSCNMNFYGDECDHCKMINIDFFLNCARSVQTSIVS